MIRCGERMAALRVKLGLTQEELAGKLGISRAALSHYETNRREPDYMTLCTIADYYQVSLDYIMCRTDEPALRQEPGAAPVELSAGVSDSRPLMVDGEPLTREQVDRLITSVRLERNAPVQSR
ncbi:helix-turn-helix domain-containing protein [Paenibacillus sp. HJGM_3]|uniref:helix-turn-helix domain-containing protein n=1 Tax=Paenibacillus sp. HJGM_3 TaxID=3379816 RepID=UPI00385FC980